MGRYGYRVIDADGHVMEPTDEHFAEKYLDPRYRETLREMVQGAKASGTALFRHQTRVPVLPTGRPLGAPTQDAPIKNTVVTIPRWERMQAKGALDRKWDPGARMEDMDKEGVDVAVLYPSGMSSYCAWEDVGLESAVYTGYHRMVDDFCAESPNRLKWVAVISMRDIDAGVKEIRRAAQSPTMVGLYLSGHMDEKLLDHPSFYPLWAEAQDLDLPIAVHGGTARPPYGIGSFEMGSNWFIQHASVNPYEQMRAMAAMIGGGVLDRFPRLRVAFLEAGCGWVPWWLDRLDEHAEMLPPYVPMLRRKPSAIVKEGAQVFISCDPDESTMEYVAQSIGEGRIVYASDYPHFDCRFPDSVRLIAERPTMPSPLKKKILEDNALQLYPRLR